MGVHLRLGVYVKVPSWALNVISLDEWSLKHAFALMDALNTLVFMGRLIEHDSFLGTFHVFVPVAHLSVKGAM